jgi:pilus assembly protein CpaE
MPSSEVTGAQGKMPDETEARRQPEAKISPRMQSTSDVILICPNEGHRRALIRGLANQSATVVSSLSLYPAYNHLLSVIEQDCDAFIIEIDSDNNAAMNLVETICDRKPSATVMVYSASQQPELLVSSMRAGAREFLYGSVMSSALGEALLRASARRLEMADRRVRGKVLMFWGAKGGSGVTTLATNFAIALRQETGGEVALLDLNPHLGDVAVLLGITPRFTITEALANPERMDKDFVATLMTPHRSGVSVLAAPDAYNSLRADATSVGKLVDLLSAQFPFVVIDAGLSLGDGAGPLFQLASTIYLVTQADIPSLRSSQRFVSYLRAYGEPNVELVLNRHEGRKAQFDDDQLTKTLGIAPKWKVPNDYQATRRAADSGAPVISDSGGIAERLRQMARAACGKPAEAAKKKSFLFGN